MGLDEFLSIINIDVRCRMTDKRKGRFKGIYRIY